jgi:hypothetical protein
MDGNLFPPKQPGGYASGSKLAWINKLHAMPRYQVILGSLAVFSVISAADFTYSYVSGHKNVPTSHNPQWAEATRSYLRFQNMNPITGVSSGGRGNKQKAMTQDEFLVKMKELQERRLLEGDDDDDE